ncbi:MAG: GNAT family N-acetyltransferase [Chloroflexota bacterium]
MNSAQILDNPVWHALTTHQADLAIGDGLAKRYPTDIAPFIALANTSAEAFADLAQIVTAGEKMVLRGFELPPEIPGWTIHNRKMIVQMISEPPTPEIESAEAILTLSEADVPDMLGLVAAAEPGPFLPRTIRLGTYLGIRKDGQLVAMAGERMYPPGYREISAVCTHPNHRGKGYARLLMSRLMAQERQQGDVPILHVMPENMMAQRVYESLGFRKRRDLPYAMLSRA